MRVGYARVSTDDQTLDLQRDALKRAKCKEIYEEHASGKNTARPQLEACLKSLRDGDTLIVWRLDRLGRSLADLIRLTHELKARGVGFASLTEQIDTRSPSGQLVFHVFGALAEFERNLIRERTLAGLKAARARGRKGGRPRKLSVKDLKTVRSMLKSGDISVSTVAEKFHVARSTLYRNVGANP
jgi:DNA invertase Pin-like site-specific DNA recombinase